MDTKKPMIYVAEDDKVYANIYKIKLEKEGFQVLISYNGRELLDALKNQIPAVLLLDLVMPVMDGYEALIEIRKDPKTKYLPVIVLTNLSLQEDLFRAKELGANNYFVKTNISVQELVDTIKKYITV